MFSDPCFKEKQSSELSRISKEDRFRHACYEPVADYGSYLNLKPYKALIPLSSGKGKIIQQFKYISFRTVSASELKMDVYDILYLYFKFM